MCVVVVITLREIVESARKDGDKPISAAFMIAAFLRTAAQGEPSTFEGDCASLLVASNYYDLESWDGIDRWLTDLRQVPDMPMPESWWERLARADMDDESAEGEHD